MHLWRVPFSKYIRRKLCFFSTLTGKSLNPAARLRISRFWGKFSANCTISISKRANHAIILIFKNIKARWSYFYWLIAVLLLPNAVLSKKMHLSFINHHLNFWMVHRQWSCFFQGRISKWLNYWKRRRSNLCTNCTRLRRNSIRAFRQTLFFLSFFWIWRYAITSIFDWPSSLWFSFLTGLDYLWDSLYFLWIFGGKELIPTKYHPRKEALNHSTYVLGNTVQKLRSPALNRGFYFCNYWN